MCDSLEGTGYTPDELCSICCFMIVEMKCCDYRILRVFFRSDDTLCKFFP